LSSVRDNLGHVRSELTRNELRWNFLNFSGVVQQGREHEIRIPSVSGLANEARHLE
jgi:hypothetical protein